MARNFGSLRNVVNITSFLCPSTKVKVVCSASKPRFDYVGAQTPILLLSSMDDISPFNQEVVSVPIDGSLRGLSHS